MNRNLVFLYLIISIILNLQPLQCMDLDTEENFEKEYFLTKNRPNIDSEKEYSLTNHLKAEARFHKFTHGEVIYVYGTSTVGKSTFTKVLSKFLGHTLVSTRDLKAQYMTKIITEIFPEEYSYVSKFISSDIILAYLSNSINTVPEELLKNKNSSEAIKKLEIIKHNDKLIMKRYHPIEQLHYIFDHLFILSGKNINVIFDNLDVLDFLQYISLNNIHCPLHLLLMYCPPDVLLERVIKRNELAMQRDVMDKRSLMRPLEGFLDIYTHATNKNFMAEVKQDNLIKIFNRAYNKSREQNDSHPLSRSSWQDVKKILMANFGASPTIKLQSKYPYDVVLNTSKETSEELASRIQLYKGTQSYIGKPQYKQNYLLPHAFQKGFIKIPYTIGLAQNSNKSRLREQKLPQPNINSNNV